MTHTHSQKPVFTTVEFDRWWEARGIMAAVAAGFEPTEAKSLSWDAWRAGREQMSEATAYQRLQPVRR